MNTNILAWFFDKVREIIEAAETPFSKLAIFILPVLAPVVPAAMTGLHIYKLMMQIFDLGGYTESASMTVAVIVGIVGELLGYVGAILFIQAVYQFIKTTKREYFLPMVINGLAYAFYLVLMWMINYRLGVYFETPEIMNQIVGLLSFITVPTGLLAANYLSQKQLNEEAYTLRQERREDRLKEKAIKKGLSFFGNEEDKPKTRRLKPASAYREQMITMLNEEYAASGKILTPKEITTRLKLDHNNSKGFVSTLTTRWKDDNNIKPPMGF